MRGDYFSFYQMDTRNVLRQLTIKWVDKAMHACKGKGASNGAGPGGNALGRAAYPARYAYPRILDARQRRSILFPVTRTFWPGTRSGRRSSVTVPVEPSS